NSVADSRRVGFDAGRPAHREPRSCLAGSAEGVEGTLRTTGRCARMLIASPSRPLHAWGGSGEGLAMTDLVGARRGAPQGVIAPKIITYTGAGRPDDLQQDSATPPDPNGAVNASYIVEFTNDFFTIYDKATGAKMAASMDAKTFWLYAGI